MDAVRRFWRTDDTHTRMDMKNNCSRFLVSLALLLSLACFAAAQDVPPASEEATVPTDVATETSTATSTVAPADGLALLDQATEAKLRVAKPEDFAKVIDLCRQAMKAGLEGENLEFCRQLLAATQIQRGLNESRLLLQGRQRPKDWAEQRDRILADLDEAVLVVNDQPQPLLRIAELNLLADGNLDENRAKRAAEVLKTVMTLSKDDPPVYALAVKLLMDTEKDPAKKEQILADAAENSDNSLIQKVYVELLFGLGRFDKGVEVLERLANISPEDRQPLEKAFQLLLLRRESELAQKVLELLKKSGMDESELTMQQIQLLEQTQKYDEAIALLDELRKKRPNDAEILMHRSDLYMRMEKYEEALKDIEAALRLRPNALRYVGRKIQIQIAQKKFDEALAAVKELRSEESDNAEYVLLETQIYLAQKDFEKAIVLMRELVEKMPQAVQWKQALLELLVEAEKYDEVIATAAQFSKDSQTAGDEADDAEATRDPFTPLLIGLLLGKKQFDKAEPLMERFIQADPDDEGRILLQAQFYLEKKDYAKSAAILEQFRAKHPEDDGLTVQLAALYTQLKKSKKAWELLEPFLEKHPEEAARLLHLKSQVMIGLNRHEEAVEALETVLKTEPDDEVSLNNLSWLLSTSPHDSIRDGKRSLELALKACELSEYKAAYILSTLAAAYAETGDFDRAIEWAKKSIELAPEDDNTKDQIESLQKELQSYENKQPFRETVEEEE